MVIFILRLVLRPVLEPLLDQPFRLRQAVAFAQFLRQY
jgi:hypothetical protein